MFGMNFFSSKTAISFTKCSQKSFGQINEVTNFRINSRVSKNSVKFGRKMYEKKISVTIFMLKVHLVPNIF